MENHAQHKLERRARFDEDNSEDVEDESIPIRTQSSIDSETQEPFMGVKVRRRASMYRVFMGDYVDVASNDQILRLLSKQGDRQVLFAESLVKVNRKAKIMRRILLITDVALYTLDTKFLRLKRRIPLQAILKIYLSETSDNFFALIIPSEYDTLLASTRKTEIVTVLVEATKKLSDSGESVEVVFSNSFEYYMDSEHVREVTFEECEGGVKTKFVDR